ncbi:MAG: hypothetical protein ACRDV1_01535 [Actinomycetes bacterium]
MTTVLILLAVLLVVVMAVSLVGAGPSWVRRRTIVERPAGRRRVIVEEDVVDDRPTTRPVVE